MSGLIKPCLYFVTPVFERYELTAICLRQKVHACEMLEKEGINATCVVIGDDDNLRVARDLGFATVTRNNDYLGRKFNDGHEYAGKHGATHTAPVGSDSWFDPKWVIGMLPTIKHSILVSRHYAIVHKTGMKRAQLKIPYVSYVLPLELIAHCNYRPVLDKRPRGCDTNTFQSAQEGASGGPIRHIVSQRSHELDTVAFQSPTQITDYDRIFSKWGVSQTYDAFGGLEEHYPIELIKEVEQLYDIKNEETSYELLKRCLPFVKKIGGGTSRNLELEIQACLIRHEREFGRCA